MCITVYVLIAHSFILKNMKTKAYIEQIWLIKVTTKIVNLEINIIIFKVYVQVLMIVSQTKKQQQQLEYRLY